MLEVILSPGAVCPKCGAGEGRQRNIWVEGKMGRYCNKCEAEWMCGKVNGRAGNTIIPTAPGGILPNGVKAGGARVHATEPKGNMHHCYQCEYQWGSVRDVRTAANPKVCPRCRSQHWQERVRREQSGLDGKDGYCFPCHAARDMVSSWTDYDGKREILRGLCKTCGANMSRFYRSARKGHATTVDPSTVT